jgi:hypothetical protein
MFLSESTRLISIRFGIGYLQLSLLASVTSVRTGQIWNVLYMARKLYKISKKKL